MGAVGMRRAIADTSRRRCSRRLTYNSHTLAAATALATIDVYEQDDLIGNARRMGKVCRICSPACRETQRRRGLPHYRSLDCRAGAIAATKAPLAPFGGRRTR